MVRRLRSATARASAVGLQGAGLLLRLSLGLPLRVFLRVSLRVFLVLSFVSCIVCLCACAPASLRAWSCECVSVSRRRMRRQGRINPLLLLLGSFFYPTSSSAPSPFALLSLALHEQEKSKT
jgi:hypothetical protein